MLPIAFNPLQNLPPPAFSDAAGAQAWLEGQKRIPGRFFDAAIEQLERLQGLQDNGLARAQILEILRPEVLATLTTNRKRFAWQARPHQPVGSAALNSNLRLWSALIAGYMQCAEGLSATPGVEPAWVAVAIHRAQVNLKLAIEDHFFCGMEPPAMLWQRALALTQMAQALGIADMPIPDPSQPELGQTSILHHYHVMVLNAMCDPAGMFPVEYTALQKVWTRWRDLPKLSTARSGSEKERWANLRLLEQPAKESIKDPAWLEVSLVRAKLKQRIISLQNGEAPENLHLTKDLNVPQWIALLTRIRRKLHDAYAPVAAHHGQASGESVFVASTVEDAFGLISGFRFNVNQRASASADRVLHERMAIFGRNSIIQDMASERPKFGEEWFFGFEDSGTLRLSNGVDSIRGQLQIGQLVSVRRGTDHFLGKVTRAGIRQTGVMEISVLLFTGTPQAADAHMLQAGGQVHFPLLLLPPAPELQQPMVAFVANGSSVGPRQTLQLNLSHPKQIQLGTTIDRGPNFEAYRI